MKVDVGESLGEFTGLSQDIRYIVALGGVEAMRGRDARVRAEAAQAATHVPGLFCYRSPRPFRARSFGTQKFNVLEQLHEFRGGKLPDCFFHLIGGQKFRDVFSILDFESHVNFPNFNAVCACLVC